MLGIRGYLDGLPVFHRAFLKLEGILSDWRPAWDAVADWFYAMMDSQWQSGGATGGTPWQDLADSTIEWKAAHGWGGAAFLSTLERTGDMKRSFTKKGAKDNIDRRERNYAEWGSTDRKARFHQEGVPSRHLPQRVILIVNDPRRLALQKAIQRALVREMKDTGLVQRTLEL